MALCFVLVLGISLASYLAICSRSMTLSNRSFQSAQSQQLAEFGLEEGLRAFNKGDWSAWASNPTGITGGTTAWTLDTTNKRASRTVTFDSTLLGQNVTATVKIRVDNYDANALGSPYNASTTYRVNDLVYYSGTATVTGNWYRSVRDGHSGNTPSSALGYPNLNYWVPAPLPWMWNSNATYSQNDFVCYGGAWYVYTSGTASSGNVPTNTIYWTRSTTSPDPTGPTLAITSSTAYYAGQYGFRVGDSTWYRCITSYTSTATWDASKWSSVTTTFPWAYNSGKTYKYNDLVFYSSTAGTAGTWYRCVAATSTGNVPTTTTYWENALTGINTTTTIGVHGWSSNSINYNPGDVVCYYTSSSYNFYRCIRAHTSTTTLLPTNTNYWSTMPLLSQDWQSNHQYSQYDTVRYKGVWYLSLSSTNNYGRLPTDASSGYWAAAPQAISAWSSSSFYDLDDIVSNSGTWYRCIAPHKNQTPPNATYWTVLTGSGSSYVWDAGTAYTSGNYRSYGGVWYKCTAATTANDGHSPNDKDYWAPTWSQPSNTSVVTGAPVIYAEASVTIAGNPANRTQLRTTIAPAALFPNAAGVSSTLTAGSGGMIDSYDGSVRTTNTGGTTSTYAYDDSTNSPFSSSNHNVGYTATLAAAGTSSPSLTLTSPTVKGYVAATPSPSSPYAPLASYGTNAYLQNSDGTVASPATGAAHVDLTRVSPSPFVPQFDTLPSGGLSSAFGSGNFPRGTLFVEPSTSANTVNIGTPGAVAPSRYYFSSGTLSISDGAPIQTLNVNGPVMLYINGELILDGDGTSPDGSIVINSTGSAEIHLTGALQVRQNSAGIQNKTLDPKKLIVISETSASYTQNYGDGGSPFYGVLYVPNTTYSYGLNFNNTAPTTNCAVYGAVSAKKITYDNNAYLHYDTSLRYATFTGVDQPYMVTRWNTLPATEQVTMP